MIAEKDQINFDSQGWPIYKMNLREILESLGGKEIDGKIVFDSNSPLMDIYPIIVVDDGMGYGVDENYIVEVSADTEVEGGYITIFREKEEKKEYGQ